MKNPHIVVGPNRQCLCGTYGDPDVYLPITCSDVLDALDRIKSSSSVSKPACYVNSLDVGKIVATILPLVQECEETSPLKRGLTEAIRSLEKSIEFHRSNKNDPYRVSSAVVAALCEIRSAVASAMVISEKST